MANTTGQADTVLNTTGYDSSIVNTTEAIVEPLATDHFQLTPRVVQLVVAIVGVFANLFVLIILCLSMLSKKTAVNKFIANQSALDLVACFFLLVNLSLAFAGYFAYRSSETPSSKERALCFIFQSGSLVGLGTSGSTSGLVIITLERYWKIVYPIVHRKYSRRWMIPMGIALPWMNGVVTFMVPSMLTSDVKYGRCLTTSFWPSNGMAQVRIVWHCIQGQWY
jgi:hypothetical protein